jgi:diguanylate cyclase (GGDEF)-like protein/PAS domain S-box-containing protein
MDENSQQSIPEVNQHVVQLIDHSPVPMMISRQDGGLQYVNAALMQLLGYPSRHISLANFIWQHQKDLMLSRTLRQMSIDNPLKPVQATLNLQHKSGEMIAVCQSCAAFSIADDEPCYFVSCLIDESQKDPNQDQLQLASLVFEASSEGMMVTDENGIILDVNDAFSEITGYSRQDAFGNNASMLSSGQQDKLFYRLMWKSIIANGQWKGEIWNRRKNGKDFPALISINTVFDSAGKVNKRIALFSDLTRIKAREKQIFQMAYYDSLTGLPNRELFMDRMNQILSLSKSRERGVALMLLDLDGFKEVNDTLGHEAGDQLLKISAERLQQCVESEDVVARLGGDEFTVIIRNKSKVEESAEKILQALSKSILLGNDRIYITCSIGITRFPDDAELVSQMLRNADQAMYAVKQRGRNGFSYFTQSMQQQALQRLNSINDLRAAIKQQQFELHYQPIVNLLTGAVDKAEALLRWQHPEKGMIYPDDFIPVAEDTGLIIEIGKWVILEALQQAYIWRETECENFQIGVNVSPLQFKSDDEVGLEWVEHLKKLGLPGSALAIEITENLLMEFSERVDRKMQHFKDGGIQISLDDFGTGYASLSYLKRFDIQFLKIDKSYVQSMLVDRAVGVMCESIIQMAHKLDIKVIAEGIENHEQLKQLKQLGCDYGQGYLFSKPLTVEAFEPLLQKKMTL